MSDPRASGLVQSGPNADVCAITGMDATMTQQQNMLPAILALALGAFAIGTSEFAAMGLLPYFAADLGVSDPQAGHVISAYALGVVVGAPLTSLFGAGLPRRRYLAALIAIYGVVNLAAAVLPGLGTLVVTRFLAGLPHGGFLGVAMLFAADAMPPERRARGAAQVMLGLTVANIVGVPLAGVLGQEIGWRWGFALPGIIAAVSAVLILRLAPRAAPREPVRPWEELGALANPRVLWVLLIAAIGFGGIFSVYAYLTAAMLATASPPAWAIPAALAMFGVGGTLSTWGSGRLTERFGINATCWIFFAAMAATQAFASLAVGSWPLMVLTAFLISASAGMLIPLQSRLMDVAGRAQNMASAMIHAAFNAANALGPFLAGLALAAGWGWRAPGMVGIGLTAAGAVILALSNWRDRADAARAVTPA
ncbi:MFS transporter [Paracoccus sp. TK19116]|uniref:MFS transporter n=1 Tax=Paracoccus albicereus TaxID=2922394 RepID=A0ABT1MPR5_9RHOB|nr:MFS transporter [Paracoccus albicereus]MCQ0970285.1 MFS transporter [Paracoccus albicereus]